MPKKKQSTVGSQIGFSHIVKFEDNSEPSFYVQLFYYIKAHLMTEGMKLSPLRIKFDLYKGKISFKMR